MLITSDCDAETALNRIVELELFLVAGIGYEKEIRNVGSQLG